MSDSQAISLEAEDHDGFGLGFGAGDAARARSDRMPFYKRFEVFTPVIRPLRRILPELRIAGVVSRQGFLCIYLVRGSNLLARCLPFHAPFFGLAYGLRPLRAPFSVTVPLPAFRADLSVACVIPTLRFALTGLIDAVYGAVRNHV